MRDIDDLYRVLVLGASPHEIDPELYDEDDDPLEILSPSYINRVGTEYGERVIYWESNYNPSAYRLGEKDGEKAKEVIDIAQGCGVDFGVDLVAKYPADYE